MQYSLYIHIPYCVSKCSYCDFFSIPVGKDCKKYIPDEYLYAVENEIKSKINKFDLCTSIFIGGGTPSLLNTEQLRFVKKILNENVLISENCEFTVECNPDDISEEFLIILNEIGVNRISCGLQSMNNCVLKSVNRRAGEEENQYALEIIDKNWTGIKSFDLISSLPGESEESFENNLKKIIEYNPHHISLYSLTIEEETPLGQDLEAGKFKYDFDAADKMWIKGRDYLISKGYCQYEVSNFAVPGYECRHNMAYWQHKNYIGIGCGATGTIYEDNIAVRSTNINNIENYINFWVYNKKDLVIEDIENIDSNTNEYEFFMMGLRTAKGISKKNYESIFNKPISENILNLFQKWKNQNLACIKDEDSDTYFSLSKDGLLFLNLFLEQLQL